MNNTKSLHLVKLNDIDLIQVSGVDSQQFLQNQLTTDINELIPSSKVHYPCRAKLSGYCTPQGRMMASFWISRSENNGDDIFNIWISKDIAEKFSKKLKMFVLRSKVFIEYIPNKHDIYAAWGQYEESSTIFEPEQTINISEITGLTFENKFYNRYLIATMKNQILENNISLQDENLTFWNFLEVISGIPRITEATQDKFVPQMINFESLHGVAFQKGCYPGQEIVARTQYRGTIKRRLFIYSIEAPIDNDYHPLPGDEIYDTEDLNQPAGMIVLSTLNSDATKYYIQIEIKIESSNQPLALKKDNLFIKLSSKMEPLPYTFLHI